MSVQFPELKDVVDIFGRIVSAVQAMHNLPLEERETYLEQIREAYTLIDGALLLVMNTLSDITEIQDDAGFRQAVAMLSHVGAWYAQEKALRLCDGLRRAERMTGTLRAKAARAVREEEWRLLSENTSRILQNEGELAEYISRGFQVLSQKAASLPIEHLRRDVRLYHRAIRAQRDDLIAQELKLFNQMRPN